MFIGTVELIEIFIKSKIKARIIIPELKILLAKPALALTPKSATSYWPL